MVILSEKEWIFLLLEINELSKSYGDRQVVSLKKLCLYAGDRVAVVGQNGAGKTTLLRMITGEENPDSGRIQVRGRLAVIPQLGVLEAAQYDRRIAAQLGVDCDSAFSGGERIKALIAAAMAQQPDVLLADEPTTNLDIAGIMQLENLLKRFDGTLLLISHDRTLLEAVCNKVLEVEQGVYTLYSCGYHEYALQKELERQTQQSRYEAYTSERDRLKQAVQDKAQQSAGVRKTPKRMGNSEARLHKMGGQGAKQKLDRAAKAVESRLDQLEKVEKPWEYKPISFDIRPGMVHNPVIASLRNVTKIYGDKVVLQGCSFDVPNHKRTVLIGPNGAGKSTLMEMIVRREEGVEVCTGFKPGYYRQDAAGVDDNKTVLQNAMESAIYNEQFVRTVLARLLFRRDEVHKSASYLSGGERLKLALACIILSDFNLLMLDEPTNFLDIESRQALEDVLRAYPGAVLLTSHDRAFIETVADRIVLIEDGQARTFEGGWEEYTAKTR